MALVNGTSASSDPRATREYSIEVGLGATVVKTVRGRFDDDVHPRPVRVDIGVPRADRVRLRALSHLGSGAGIAEIRWE